MSATILDAWASPVNSAPIGPIAPSAGSDRILTMILQCESALFTSIATLTIGGQTYDGSSILSHSVEATHLALVWWLEAKIAAFSGTAVDYADNDNLGVDRMDNFSWATYQGVDQTTPVTLQDSDTTTNTANTIDLTDGSGADDRVIVGVCRNSGNRRVDNWDGLTELYDLQPALSNYRAAAGEGAGNQGIITLTGDGISDDWLAGLWSINAAAVSDGLLARSMNEGLLR